MAAVSKLKEAVLNELQDEEIEAAKEVLKSKMKELRAAKKIVKNIEREIEDLEADIEDGTFTTD
jgi:hypothetical protein